MINSDKNQKIQLIRSLIDQPKERKKTSLFVVEGVRLVEDVYRAGWEIKYILFSKSLSPRGKILINNCKERNVTIEEIPESLMEKLADTDSPQGIIAVVAQTEQKISYPLDFVIICDGIRDPGNLGTIFRTAVAAGVQTILLSPGTTDPYSPKVVRSGMGAHFFVPILKLSWEEIKEFCSNQPEPLKIIVSKADTNKIYWQSDFTKPSAIVIGAEAEGVSDNALQMADQFISIPMSGKTESLNAASAASIFLFEVVRQRSQ